MLRYFKINLIFLRIQYKHLLIFFYQTTISHSMICGVIFCMRNIKLLNMPLVIKDKIIVMSLS